MKQRIKLCNVCNIDLSTMYKVQYKNPKGWIFVCENSLLKIKANNSAYKYGGTCKK